MLILKIKHQKASVTIVILYLNKYTFCPQQTKCKNGLFVKLY